MVASASLANVERSPAQSEHRRF